MSDILWSLIGLHKVNYVVLKSQIIMLLLFNHSIFLMQVTFICLNEIKGKSFYT